MLRLYWRLRTLHFNPHCHHESHFSDEKEERLWGFPGGPAAETVLPMQGPWVLSLAGEFDPTCCS